MPEINLRREMVRWLSRRGHWIVLRSFQATIPSAVDVQTNQTFEPSRGVYDGRHYVDYIVRGDRRAVVPELEFDTAVGNASGGIDHFYLESNVPAKQDDLILEVELGQDGLPIRPYKIRRAYKIVRVEDMRDGAGLVPGRVEFFQCRVAPVSVRP